MTTRTESIDFFHSEASSDISWSFVCVLIKAVLSSSEEKLYTKELGDVKSAVMCLARAKESESWVCFSLTSLSNSYFIESI